MAIRAALADCSFAGFRKLSASDTERAIFDFAAVDYYFDETSAPHVASGSNWYGSHFAIEIHEKKLLFDVFDDGMAACEASAMAVLEHLVVTLGHPCHWWGYAIYEDSGESSDVERGTEKELRALFSAP